MKPGNMKELLELIKNGSISYLGNTRGINENDCKKLIFPLAIIFKSGIIKTQKLLWYTNPHISVDRLIFVLSGDRGLLTVCRLAHPEATEVSSESPTCFFTSRVQIQTVDHRYQYSIQPPQLSWQSSGLLIHGVTGSSPVRGHRKYRKKKAL